MRKLVTLIAGLALATLMGPRIALAEGDGNGIVGSAHDFTDNVYVEPDEGSGLLLGANVENDDSNPNAFNNKRKEICRVCHVPHDHGEVRYGNQGILWNHEVTTKTTWQMYASDPNMINYIDGTIEPAPAGTSKLCLGCHDGVTAINQYDGASPADPGYGNGQTYVMGDYSAGFVIGNTTAGLTNNHPISITYAYGVDPQLKDPASATMWNGDTVQSLLVNGRVECSTCHDVHNRESVPNTHLLREQTKGADLTGAGASKLCLVCHDK